MPHTRMPALRRQGRAITKHISPHRILPGLDQAQNEEEEASSFDDEHNFQTELRRGVVNACSSRERKFWYTPKNLVEPILIRAER